MPGVGGGAVHPRCTHPHPARFAEAAPSSFCDLCVVCGALCRRRYLCCVLCSISIRCVCIVAGAGAADHTQITPITLYNWSQSSSHTPVFQFRPSYLPQCTSGAMPYSFRAYASSACLPHPERPAQACCREPDSSIVK